MQLPLAAIVVLEVAQAPAGAGDTAGKSVGMLIDETVIATLPIFSTVIVRGLSALATPRAVSKGKRLRRRSRIRIVVLVDVSVGVGSNNIDIACTADGHPGWIFQVADKHALRVGTAALQRLLDDAAIAAIVTIVVIIADVDVAVAIHGHAIGRYPSAADCAPGIVAARQSLLVEIAAKIAANTVIAFAFASVFAYGLARDCDFASAFAAAACSAIGNIDVAVAIHGHTLGSKEGAIDQTLGIAATGRRQLEDAEILIGHIDIALGIDRHAGG